MEEKYHIFINSLEREIKDIKTFPWREKPTPYNILIAEILLQQTDSKKVSDIFSIFIKKYPTLEKLSKAKIEDIKNIINKIGLKYKSERLICIAKNVIDENNGKIPPDKDKLLNFNGIGNYIANSILCFGYNRRVSIVDTNIIRIYKRIFNIKTTKNRPRNDPKIWNFAEQMLPKENYVDFNYALLDFGAEICTARNPKCDKCPMQDICYYYNNEVEKDES